MNSNKMERGLLGLLAVLTAALLVTIYDGIHEPNVMVGDTAPNFKVVTDRGRTMTRADFGGKVLVLNFWATWCPPCIEELPSLNQFQKEMAGSGIVVLGVSVDKNEAVYKAFLKRNGVVFETARDPSTEISAGYGTYKYPETYVIDASGKVRQKRIGQVNWMDPEVMSSIKGLL